ncbi:MAG: hypothetical protein QOJ02_3019 [Acidobacteriota bacterium]|jgi:hypothetical protein|nr:hypothetical protein [Acidobacteriota bacterium]
MEAEKSFDEKPVKIVRQNPLLKKIALYAVGLIVGFLLGFIPMWLTARDRANQLAGAQQELRLARMENMLASAAIYGRRGDYEPARQSASDFFTALQTETGQENGSTLTQAQRDSMKPLFAQRDDIITLLARSDPASADRLSDLYVSYRQTVKRP